MSASFTFSTAKVIISGAAFQWAIGRLDQRYDRSARIREVGGSNPPASTKNFFLHTLAGIRPDNLNPESCTQEFTSFSIKYINGIIKQINVYVKKRE